MEKPDTYIGNHDESDAISEQNIGMTDPVTGGPDWIGVARDAYKRSTDYYDANIRKQVEKNISFFRNRHYAGSKYNLESFRHRS